MNKAVIGRMCLAFGMGLLITGLLLFTPRVLPSGYQHWLEIADWWSLPLWNKVFPSPPNAWLPSLSAFIGSLATNVFLIAGLCYFVMIPSEGDDEKEG